MRSILLLLLAVVLFNCSDECDSTIEYYATVPVYSLKDSVREAVEVQESRAIDTPEKIYFKDDFIFIVESGTGIHVIDNTDKTNPVGVKFIQIPGNHDVAIQDNFLYADNYIDLLVFDIADIENITLHNRVESVFEFYGGFFMESSTDNSMIVTDWKEELIVEEFTEDCGGDTWWGAQDDVALEFSNNRAGVNSQGSGTGGSMARFTISNGHLYTVDLYSIRHFDLTDPSAPDPDDPLDIGWDIETVFPYENNLFIGSRSGMNIYSIEDPANPSFVSIFNHANACDPVVVEGDIAYVTLRDGTECETFTNQLDVIDISNLENPTLIRSYPMFNPHGLGIQDGCLYICDGDEGLKYYDATDANNIELIKQYDDIHALDVIPLNERLLLIGNDGFYQYEGFCQDEIFFLSALNF